MRPTSSDSPEWLHVRHQDERGERTLRVDNELSFLIEAAADFRCDVTSGKAL
jgi:hypothetical protein